MTTVQKERITRDRVRMFSGVSGGGDFFSETEATAVNGTSSAAAVDNALAIEEAASGPKLETIVLGCDCRQRIVAAGVEAQASRIATPGRVTIYYLPRTT